MARALRAVLTPHRIAPPIKLPFLSMTEAVVAVPRSKRIIGAGYLAMAATAPTTISAPSSPGLSVLIFSPVLTPGPTKIGALPVTNTTALEMVRARGGTTVASTAPSSADGSRCIRSSTLCSLMAYSSAVSLLLVDRRYLSTMVSPSIKPITILVLPTSMARIIAAPSFS